MSHGGTCQKCRQPLLFDTTTATNPTSIADSVGALARSSYDLLSASERRPLPPTQQATAAAVAGRLPAARRALYQAATQPRASAAYPSSRGAPPPTRLHVPSPYPATPLGPGESFVVLDHVAQSLAALPPPTPPHSSSPSGPSSLHPLTTSTSADQPTATPAAPSPLTPHLTQLSHLSTFLSSRSSIDHPLCTECMDLLLGMMGRELEEGKKERERLAAWEREVLKRREGGAEGGEKVTREGLQREIAKYRKAERLAITDLKSVEAERLSLDAEIAALDLEEKELAEQEEGFWRDHSSYVLQAAQLRDQTNALQTRYEHDVRELEKLQKTNVYNDTFCIGQEAGFGTINGLRLGRLPNIPVPWPEINAAWGHTLLLLHTIARKFGYQRFEGWRLVPMGSFSWIEKLPLGSAAGAGEGKGERLELYGSDQFALNSFLQNRRFDQAMVAFLDCLRQLIEWVVSRDGGAAGGVRVPHLVSKDKIGDVSIKLQFGSEETWTRALRHVLLDLKILLGRASL